MSSKKWSIGPTSQKYTVKVNTHRVAATIINCLIVAVMKNQTSLVDA